MPRNVNRFGWYGQVFSENGPKTSSARLVAAALFGHMNREGTNAFPTERTLADDTSLARSTVQGAIPRLIADGWLLRREKGRGKFGKPTYVYEATLPDEADRNRGSNANGLIVGPIDELINGPTPSPIAEKANGLNGKNHWPDSTGSMDRQAGHNQSTFKKPVMERPPARPEPGSESDLEESDLRIRVRDWAKGACALGMPMSEAERKVPLGIRYRGYEKDVAAIFETAAAEKSNAAHNDG